MSESLDNVLSDEIQAVEEQAIDKPVEQKNEVVEEKPVEKQEVKPEVKQEQKQEQQKMTDKERALLASAKDERRKRQDLERRIAEMEASRPVEEPKQFWEDPEEKLLQFKTEVQGMMRETRLNTVEDIARTKYSDFDEKIDVFAEVLQQTPGLREQWLNSPNPAEFAYKLGKNYQDLNNAGNLDSMLAAKEKELRLKIEAEFAEKAESKKKELESLPTSLSGARSTGSNSQIWNGPSSFNDILKG